MTTHGPLRIQVKHGSRWRLHCRTRTLPLARDIARRLQADGFVVRIVRAVVHR